MLSGYPASSFYFWSSAPSCSGRVCGAGRGVVDVRCGGDGVAA